MTGLKPQPNHRIYLETLRKMSAEQKLLKVFELSSLSKSLFKEGLRRTYSNLTDEQFNELFISRIKKCYNRNY